MRQARIIIAGSRSFNNYETLKDRVTKFLYTKPDDRVIISGGAKGADALGERYAQEYHIPVKRFPANWDTYGKKAGILRNIEMAKYATDDNAEGILIAFWDGVSHGTGHMLRIADDYGMEIYLVRF